MKLTASTREITGKKVKTIRAEGKVPSVVYGPSHESQNVSVNAKDFRNVFADSGFSKLVDFELGGDKLKVLIKDVQVDPVRRTPLHVDFYAVDMNKKIEAEVPVQIVGVSPAVKNNIGFLEQQHSTINVRCLPSNLPQFIEVDISNLAEIGDGVSMSELNLGEGVEIADEFSEEERVVGILAPQKEIEEEEPTTDAEGEEAAEADGSEGEAAAGADGDKSAAGDSAGESDSK